MEQHWPMVLTEKQNDIYKQLKVHGEITYEEMEQLIPKKTERLNLLRKLKLKLRGRGFTLNNHFPTHFELMPFGEGVVLPRVHVPISPAVGPRAVVSNAPHPPSSAST